jgi:hypothetical protein
MRGNRYFCQNFEMMTSPKKLAKPASQPHLSNLQLTLLKLYATDVSEEDLKAIQRLIARYFAEKATSEADKDYLENGYTAEAFLKHPLRTPYNPSIK